jgi:uncharacterized Zn-binding protein involved in type VI secretion
MANPAAKQGDQVVSGGDIHIIMIPTPGGPVPTPLPHPFAGQLDQQLSSDVNVQGKPAATQQSVASNTPHVPQGGPFQTLPKNRGEILVGSSTVMINGKPAARAGDQALTCHDPADAPTGSVIAVSTVMIGG